MSENLFGANDEIALLSGVTLTAAYTGNTTAAKEHRSYGGLTLLLKYTPHASSATAYAQVQVEVSYDGTTWLPYGEWTRPSTGVREFESSTFKINQTYPSTFLTLDELRGRYFRVKAQEASVTASFFGTLTVYGYTHSF
jgi:hypothetical protein